MPSPLIPKKSRWYFCWRAVRFWWQRRTRGWDDSVTWDLDKELAAWLAPRLRRFCELNNGFPRDVTTEAWDAELDEICWALDWYVRHAYTYDVSVDEWERAKRGLARLGARWCQLWW